MAGSNDILYVKADKNKEVTKRDVTLGDVLTMECVNQAVLSKVKTFRLLKIPETGQTRFAVSILKVIECIHKEYPNLEIQNMGEMDFIVTYENQKPMNPVVRWIKVASVVVITFMGAAFSIMTFNNDVNVTKLFDQVYELLTGYKPNGFTILELTYSIGLIIGILVFFNHFGKKRFTVDPTPIEVEMRLYENDIQTTLIETYSRKEQELDAGRTNHTGGHRT